MNSNQIINLLEEYHEKETKRIQELQKFEVAAKKRKSDSNENPNEDSIPHAVFDKFLALNDEKAIVTMTNFTSIELHRIYSYCESVMNSYYGRGRGQKPKTGSFDSIFITLAVLKHYEKWEKAALDFGMKSSTLEALVMRTISLIEPVLTKQLISVRPMHDLVKANPPITFKYYPEALLAHDVRFQPSQRPKTNFEEAKHYFSGKHWRYGLKIESSHHADGTAAYVGVHHAGSVHDYSIFTLNSDMHKKNTTKKPEDKSVPDKGLLQKEWPTLWAMLLDKAYNGAEKQVRAITPNKGNNLSYQDDLLNEHIAHDRVIAENFYGRATQLWGALRETWRWDHGVYDQVVCLLYALTNLHIMFNPLRAQDRDYYSLLVEKYIADGKERIEKEKQWKKNGKERRLMRLKLAKSSQP